MIWKAGVTMGAFYPVAAAIARDKGATVASSIPTIWHFVGYPFEAGSMIAGLCACIAVRFYITNSGTSAHRMALDVPVSALALMFTAAAVMKMRPDPALALVMGTGLGAMGAGIIAIAKSRMDKLLGALGLGGDEPKSS